MKESENFNTCNSTEIGNEVKEMLVQGFENFIEILLYLQ